MLRLFQKLKSLPQLIVLLIFVIVIAVVISLIQPSIPSFKLHSADTSSQIKPTITVKSVQATDQTLKIAKIPASPSANPLPQHWGRSVNIPILTYHYIGLNPNPEDKTRDNLSVHPDTFDDQVSLLQSHGYTPITLDTAYAILKGNTPSPSKPIILTFDDGYIDFYLNAYPILKKYGFHATSFIPTGLIDQGYYLHWDQIKEMDASGLISFQAHSVHHPNLVSLSSDQVSYELVESKRVLQEKLGKTVNFMAYPYGASNQISWKAAENAGYLGAVGTWYGTTLSEGAIYDLPRIKIPGSWTKDQFAQRFP